MPAGELLIEEVAKALSITNAKTVRQIRIDLTFRSSQRAIRYAIVALVERGRAKRIGLPGQQYKVMAVAQHA